jgi:cell division protein FtsN
VFDRAVKPAPQLESKGQPQSPVQPEQHASATVSHDLPLRSDQVAMTMQAMPVAWMQETETRPHSDAPVRAAIPADNAMVQIGSYNTAALAKGAWDRFKADHGQLANGFNADVREANLGDRGVKYRLRFGPLPNSAATARCKELERQGAACLVTPF